MAGKEQNIDKSLIAYIESLEDRIINLESRIAKASAPNGVKQRLYMSTEEAIKSLPKLLKPIKAILEDRDVSDILINGHESVYFEKGGKTSKSKAKFSSEEELLEIAKVIAASVNRVFDEDRPYIDARLPDGSRVNIAAPPLTLDGTAISIRKFPEKIINLDRMVKDGGMSAEMAKFFKVSAKAKANILIVGGTGSGKTTLLNAISQYIDDDERIVTIEDSAELTLITPHKVRMESKPKFGRGDDTDVSIKDLVINALRMRPDRVIIGEVRGDEAFDMIQAINTGHEGSMTTIHANSPREALIRLESMINQAAPSVPSNSIKQRIVAALDILVMVNRMPDGQRVVTKVTEVTGMEGGTVSTQDLFTHVQVDVSENKFYNSHIIPRFSIKARRYGCFEELTSIFKRLVPASNNS